MGVPLRVLILEDSPDDALLLKRHLERGGYDVSFEQVDNAAAWEAALERGGWDIIIADYNVPGFNGRAALKAARDKGVELPFIVVSGTIGEDTAVEMMRAGAQDYLIKGALARLAPAVERELREAEVRRERRRAETALRESEERFRSISGAALDAVVMIDHAGRVTVWNQAAQRMFGWSAAEIVGREMHAILTPARYQEAYRRGAERFRATGEGEAMGKTREMSGLRKDGEEIPVELSVSPCRIGDQWHAVGIMRDITERRRVETALRESETRYRLIANNVADVIWSADLNLRFTFISPSVTRMRGYTVEEALAQTPADVLTPVSLEQAMALFRDEMSAALAGTADPRRTINAEWEERCKDGSTIWTENELSVLRDDQQQIVGVIGVTRDITPRKRMEEERTRLEEQLRQSQKMEAIGRLAGGVAHDFNNILTGILGYTELLLSGLRPHDPSRGDLTEIKRAAERASSLTAQLLAFSRKQVIDPRVIDPNALLADCNQMLMRLVGEDVAYRFLPGERLGRIKVDPGQMEQLLVNLVVNARDAMPEGGVLTVETANTAVDENYRQMHPDAAVGEYVSVMVSDTGCGMDETTRNHLFEPFFTTKEKGKGTGLGLSMVYGIVTQHGGFINVYSEVGVGTTFKACFPLVREEPEAVSTAKATALPTGTETILVVEDEEMVRNLTKKALERFGYRVLAVDGGGDAFLLCRDHPGPIDLLLTDVVLPGMNGRALYENVRPLRAGLKVMFMSGYTEHVIVDRGVLEKGINFIQKPFTIETLARKVRQALDAG